MSTAVPPYMNKLNILIRCRQQKTNSKWPEGARLVYTAISQFIPLILFHGHLHRKTSCFSTKDFTQCFIISMLKDAGGQLLALQQTNSVIYILGTFMLVLDGLHPQVQFMGGQRGHVSLHTHIMAFFFSFQECYTHFLVILCEFSLSLLKFERLNVCERHLNAAFDDHLNARNLTLIQHHHAVNQLLHRCGN